MEIERKFIPKSLPENLSSFEHHTLVQGYLNRHPVLRVRKEDDTYYITYKGSGLLAREEYNLPLNQEGFEHLLPKADGNIISKTRYFIPLENPVYLPANEGQFPDKLLIELDIFDAPLAPLVMAEVEFPDEASAHAFQMPDWFEKEVTNDPRYHNSNMSDPEFIKANPF